MHELARCAVTAGGRALDGYVAAFDEVTMTIASEHGGVGSFQDGDDVKVLVLDEVRGEVRYEGWVAKAGPTTLQVTGLELTSTLQKRQVARVSITQMCTGVVGATTITFVVLDIGAQGMRIATTARLMLLDQIVFEFPTGDRDVPLVAEIVRSQRTESGSTQYGCRFVGLRESDSDAMFRYVLHAQGVQRRTRLQT